MVGVTGFEPVTSRPPDARATKLRYTPTLDVYFDVINDIILMILLDIAMKKLQRQG